MAKKPTLFYIDKKDADKAHGCPLIALDQGRLDVQKDGNEEHTSLSLLLLIKFSLQARKSSLVLVRATSAI